MALALLFLSLFEIAASQNGIKSARIIGGNDATDVPWIVALVWKKKGSIHKSQFCAGSIIDDRWILTAAHCTVDLYPSNFRIVAGIPDFDDKSTRQARGILSIYMHEEYDDWTLENDIALLELKSPLELNNNVAVIDLANEGNPMENGQEYTVEGWGAMDVNGYEYPTVLQVLAGLPQWDIKTCAGLLSYISLTKHICAGGEVGYDACFGDSGGPMWMSVDSTPLLYGITSWGEGCAGDIPAVWTRVSAFREWIESKTSFNLSNPWVIEESDSCDCKPSNPNCDCPDSNDDYEIEAIYTTNVSIESDSCDCESLNTNCDCPDSGDDESSNMDSNSCHCESSNSNCDCLDSDDSNEVESSNTTIVESDFCNCDSLNPDCDCQDLDNSNDIVLSNAFFGTLNIFIFCLVGVLLVGGLGIMIVRYLRLQVNEIKEETAKEITLTKV